MNLPEIFTASPLKYSYQAVGSLSLCGWGESETAELLIIIFVAALQQSYRGLVHILRRPSGVKRQAFKADIALIIITIIKKIKTSTVNVLGQLKIIASVERAGV